MYFKESLQKVFNGNSNISRQLTLFSICGILGLVDVYVMLNGFSNIGLVKQIGYIACWVLFLLYFTGYETLFLQQRELPEIDLKPFKIMCSKTLLAVFAFILAIFVLRLTVVGGKLMLLCDMLLAIPLVAIQAGYSYNFDECDAFKLIKRIDVKDFFILLFKRIGVMTVSYLIALITIITALVGLAIGILIVSKGEPSVLLYSITAQQTVLAKLVVFIAAILLEYVLVNGSLMWDYELIKTLENKNVTK